MAEDTQRHRPGALSNLWRTGRNLPHWHQGRRWLLAEGAAGVLIGVIGLIGVALAGFNGHGFRLLGIPLTPALSALLLVIGVGAFGAATRHRAAKLFTASMSAIAVALMIVSAVAAAHDDPGPLGFTTPAILLWAVLFCYNFGVGMWLVPEYVEGHAWRPRRLNKAARSDATTPEQ